MTEQQRCERARAALSDRALAADDGLTDALPIEDRRWLESLAMAGNTLANVTGLVAAMDFGPVTAIALVSYFQRVLANYGDERFNLADAPAPPKVAGYLKPRGPSERG